MEKQQKITACAFLHNDGKLFIAKRAATKKFLPNKWELPGGHIEFGETIATGLQREFQEEFQVAIEVGEPFYDFTYTRDTDSLHVIEVIHFATLADQHQQIKLNPEDHSAYQWISSAEVADFLEAAEPETEAVKQGFSLLRHGFEPIPS